MVVSWISYTCQGASDIFHTRVVLHVRAKDGSPNTSIDPNAIGERIRQAISQSGHSQRQFAAQLGISKDTLSHYVNGRIPRADILYSISVACGVSMEWLLTGLPAYWEETHPRLDQVDAAQRMRIDTRSSLDQASDLDLRSLIRLIALVARLDDDTLLEVSKDSPAAGSIISQLKGRVFRIQPEDYQRAVDADYEVDPRRINQPEDNQRAVDADNGHTVDADYDVADHIDRPGSSQPTSKR